MSRKLLGPVLVIVVVLVAIVSLAGLADMPFQESRVVFFTGNGEVSVPVEVADTEAEMAQGLMLREQLEGGMFFVFEQKFSYFIMKGGGCSNGKSIKIRFQSFFYASKNRNHRPLLFQVSTAIFIYFNNTAQSAKFIKRSNMIHTPAPGSNNTDLFIHYLCPS